MMTNSFLQHLESVRRKRRGMLDVMAVPSMGVRQLTEQEMPNLFSSGMTTSEKILAIPNTLFGEGSKLLHNSMFFSLFSLPYLIYFLYAQV
jgi:hypothetical protein